MPAFSALQTLSTSGGRVPIPTRFLAGLACPARGLFCKSEGTFPASSPCPGAQGPAIQSPKLAEEEGGEGREEVKATQL